MAAPTPTENLNAMLLMYAGQLAAEGDYPALRKMGFKNEQIGRFKRISVFQMSTMARSLGGKLINARVDPDAIDALFKICERASSEKETELALVKAGASQELMKRLFGLNLHQYVIDRDFIGIKNSDVGRRKALDEAADAEVWQAWQSLAWQADEARRYLGVHSATGVSIRDIEATLKRHGAWHGLGAENALTDGAWHAFTRSLLRNLGEDDAAHAPAAENQPDH